MDWIQTLWRRPAPKPLSTEKSDHGDVFPLHMLDESKTLRDITVTWTLRFDDVLDAGMLRDALESLLEIGEWRKVGGRLRRKGVGLEVHVPTTFTEDRPAFTYSSVDTGIAIDDHPLAKLLPRSTEGASIQPGPDQFREFGARKDAPSTLVDFLAHDTPVLSLHITSFTNATLVALSWPHVLMDVMGQKALLQAWSLVLAGRLSEVPPLLGAREDVLLKTPEVPKEAVDNMKFKQRRLEGAAFARFGLRFAWDLLWNPTVETKTIYLPQSAVAKLRVRAEADLLAQHGGEREKHFISDGDILTAWAVRTIALSLPQPRPLTVLHAINARFRLAELVQSTGVYVQNMALASMTFLSPQEAIGSLGSLALSNRHQLAEQSTTEHITAFLQDLRSQTEGSRDPNIIGGDANTVLVPVTNWSRADFWRCIDFSAAVVGGGGREGRGRLMYHHSASMQTSAAVRNVVVVLGKDREGGYWLTGLLLPRTWRCVGEEIGRI